MTNAQRKAMIEGHFNLKALSLQILTKLKSIDFQTVKEHCEIKSDQKALAKLKKFINTSTKEYDPRHDNDAAMLGYLCLATKYMIWASTSLRKFLTVKHTYHEYILALQENILMTS